jgi:ABC-type proline/glycine betaine transport system ATPase subunit
MADRVALIDHGRLIQSGRPAELAAAPATAWVRAFLEDAAAARPVAEAL